MGILLEIHYVVAFLLVLCAIVFSWSALGRRVVNVVAGLQLLLGIAVAAVMGASRMQLPQTVWLHILGAIVIVVLYGAAARLSSRAGGAKAALICSILGLIFVLATFYLGMHMAGKA